MLVASSERKKRGKEMRRKEVRKSEEVENEFNEQNEIEKC